MRKLKTIEEVRISGKSANLTLLSTEYIKEIDLLKWECNKCGFIFHKTLRQIEYISKSKCDFEKESALIKCDKCRNQYFVNYFKELVSKHVDAKTNNCGQFLSDEYRTLKTFYSWRCEFGHEWKTKASIVRKGHWCPYCSGLATGTIKEMRKLAEKRGGKCLSEEYLGSGKKLLWECSMGHSWKASPNKVKIGHWCTHCSSSLSERMVRYCFETIFSKKFEKARPDWLKFNKSSLELDGFNEELKLAFEHNGSQHYELAFNSTEEKLAKRKFYDLLKIEKCKENVINLIVVPPLFEVLPLNELKDYIIEQCKNKDIKIPEIINDIDYSIVYKHPDNKKYYKEAEDIVNKKGGKLLSKEYINSMTPLKIECENGHIFKKTLIELRECWCFECSINKKKTIEEVKAFAKEINLECLSKEYENQNESLIWKCNECGKEWTRSYKKTKRSYSKNGIKCANIYCDNHKCKNEDRFDELIRICCYKKF